MAGSKKAGKCENGTWQQFMERILDGDASQVSCKACAGLLQEHGFSAAAAASFVAPARPKEEEIEEAEAEDIMEPEDTTKDEDMTEEIDDLKLDAMAKKICVHYQVFFYGQFFWTKIYSIQIFRIYTPVIYSTYCSLSFLKIF